LWYTFRFYKCQLRDCHLRKKDFCGVRYEQLVSLMWRCDVTLWWSVHKKIRF
jgi:hypothetical protein